MMFWTDHDPTGWGWTLMTISMLVFWGLLIAGGVLIYRAINQPADGAFASPQPSPEQVLAERFARGEIDEQEYERRLAILDAARDKAPTS